MSHRLKITIKNETDHALFVADDAAETALKPPAVLATGSNQLPNSIEPHKEANFTVATPINGPGPEGSLVLQFDVLQMQAVLSWTDFKANTSATGDSAVPDPCSCTEKRLDGARGKLDASIKYFDNDDAPVDVANLAQKETEDANAQKSAIDRSYRDPKHAPPVPMPALQAKFTLKVEVPATTGSAPSRQPAEAPAGFGRPGGGSRMVIGQQYPRWHTAGMSMRRKRLLAAIGNCFPMVWGQKAGDVEQNLRKVPCQSMGCWTPGDGTSCTNVATYIETLLTGGKGKWGFFAYLFEEAWVPWGANPAKPMPNVGDVYLMYSDLERENSKKTLEKPQLRHVGFILHVPENEKEQWVTADGGQLGIPGSLGQFGGGAHLTAKHWVKRVPTTTPKLNKTAWDEALKAHLFAKPIEGVEYPYLTGGAESKDLDDANRLIGWLDIDSPAITFLSSDFDEPLPEHLLQKPKLTCQQLNRYNQKRCITEADHQFLGAWIDALRGFGAELDNWLAHIKNPANNPAPMWRSSYSRERSPSVLV